MLPPPTVCCVTGKYDNDDNRDEQVCRHLRPELVRSRIKELADLLHQSPGRKRFLKKVDLLVHAPW
jgi:hypothetical protein